MSEPIVCPACQGTNPANAVFCGNTSCHKALGGFPYVGEELRASRARWYHRLADAVAAWVGTPHFLAVHAVWFGVWLAINTGVVAVVAAFDTFPFDLLAVILGIEAVFITGLLLISNNRQSAHADLRGELDYEVNVKTYRKLGELEVLLRELQYRLGRLEGALRLPPPSASDLPTRPLDPVRPK